MGANTEPLAVRLAAVAAVAGLGKMLEVVKFLAFARVMAASVAQW